MGRNVAQICNNDSERLQRVLNAKARIIGIDAGALDKQVQERKAREAAEKAANGAYARVALHTDDLILLQQQQAEEARRAWNHDVTDFRQTQQGKTNTREWDLNRPDAKLLDRPARVADDDEACGPASLQKFDGEDLSAADRTAAQMEQCKGWWQAQLDDKAQATARAQEDAMQLASTVRGQDMLQLELREAEAAIRRTVNREVRDANAAMAEDARQRREAERNAELAQKQAELEVAMASPWLTEDPNVAASAQSPLRVRKDHWKGMSELEKRAVLEQQLAQMEEKRARKQAQEAQEAAYARTQHAVLKELDEQVRKAEDFRRQQAVRSAGILQQQQQEKQQRQQQMNELYANKIAPEYFMQWGTSHR